MNRAFLERTRRIAPIVFGFVAVVGIYVAISVHFRHVGLMAPDESYYTLAARSVYEGHVPYRDFSYTQMPYVPYINGFVMSIIGFGLNQHRLVSSIFGGIGLLFIIIALRQRLGSFEPAFAASFLFAASPRWGFLQSMGVWCGIAGMMLNIALAAVLWRGFFRARATVFVAAGVMAVWCRLSAAPILAVLGLIMLIQAPNLKERIYVIALSLVLAALAFLPFYLVDPKSFVFMNWLYHMESQAVRALSLKVRLAWDVAPGAIVVLPIGMLAAPRLFKMKQWTELLLLLAGLVAVVVPMIPSGAWGSYLSSSVPLASVAGVTAIWTGQLAIGNPHRHILWLLPLMSLLHMMPLEVREGSATEVEEMGAFIRNELEEGPILTPATIIAVESGRNVIKGTEMGHFSAMAPWDVERAELFKMTTLPKLVATIEDQEPVAIIIVYQPSGWLVWNFAWALPSMQNQPEENIKALDWVLADCYRPAWRTSTMEILVRKKNW
jgi:hypothetical protein